MSQYKTVASERGALEAAAKALSDEQRAELKPFKKATREHDKGSQEDQDAGAALQVEKKKQAVVKAKQDEKMNALMQKVNEVMAQVSRSLKSSRRRIKE